MNSTTTIENTNNSGNGLAHPGRTGTTGGALNMNRTRRIVARMFSTSSLLLVDSAIKGTALVVLAALAAMFLRCDTIASQQDGQPSAMKPKHESVQPLFREWQDSGRTEGKISVGALGSVA